MEPDQNLVDTYLDRAIAEFHSSPLSTQLIRRLASEFPQQFSVAGLRHIEHEKLSRAHKLVLVLLLHKNVLFDQLVNPMLGSRERAMNLLNRLLAIDPSFDVKLARRLPDRTGVNHAEAMDVSQTIRALDLLDEASPGRRVVPIVAHLVDSKDPGVSAKATLFIGRRLQSTEWAEKQLDRPEERVRANAVEAIWGLNSDSAKELLEKCARDESNRVAGNALVGLHIIDSPGILDEVNRMVQAPTPKFRSTAAWAMGRIGNPSFVIPLTFLLKDESAMVRSAAIRSLIELRRGDSKHVVKAAPKLENVSEKLAAAPVVVPEIPEVSQVPELPQTPAKQAEPPPFAICLDGSFSAGRSRK